MTWCSPSLKATSLGLIGAMMLACLARPAVAAPPAVDADAVESARFVLAKALTVSQGRSYHEVLRSLRHLRDPALAPLFEHLAGSEHPVLQIHGILGLGEISPTRKVDLKRIIALTDPLAQAELITAALDDSLLDGSDCEQLIQSQGLDISVRLLIANELVRLGKPVPAKLLDDAIASDHIGRKALAALLKLQSGDPQGEALLSDLSKLSGDQRNGVRMMVLDTAVKYKFDKIGPWALTVASEPDLPPQLDAIALHAALRFASPGTGPSGAATLWQRRFAAATDPAQQTRLALTATRLSPWLDADFFAPLKAHDDPLIRQMGVAGEAIARKENVARAVVGLVQLYHPVASRLAMTYAHEEAAPEDAKLILLSLVIAFEQGPRERKAHLLEDTITAAQLLYEKAPEDAVTLLRPLLGDSKTDEHVVHGILLGLVRTQEPGADRVLVGLPPFANPHVTNAALLLKAKSDQPLGAAELDELAILVRGGGRLQDTLRVQAAWAYLKRVDLAGPTLAAVLKQ